MEYKLSQVFEFIRNGANIKQFDTKEGYPITRIETISNSYIDLDKMGYANINELGKFEEYLLKDGDILMSHINSEKHLGKTALFEYRNRDIIHGMNLLCLRPIKEIVLPKYANYYFKDVKFTRQIPKITKKSVNQASFSVKDVKEIKIEIPNMITQKRIVSVLDKAQELIDKRKAQIEALDELVKSRFIEMFGDPVLNPKNFDVKSFDEVFDISSSARILKSEWKTEGTIPFYRVRDMVLLSERGVAQNEFFVSEEFYKSLSSNKGIPQEDDIMVSATSTIGKCYVVKKDEKFYYKDADVLRFRKKIKIQPVYFVHFMKTSYAVNQIKRTFGVTTVPHFTIVNSKKINMIYPPLELQNQFVDFVKQVDKLKSEMQDSLKELEDNFNSLMQKAFKGELFN